MAQIGFGTSAQTLDAVLQALLLARSLRAFGGTLSDQPFWLYLPHTLDNLAPDLAAQLDAAGVAIKHFVLDEGLAAFPFATKTVAAALCEERAQTAASFLAWLDCDALILQEPRPLLLPAGAMLGYRPVDHTLIGSPADQPLDGFWSLVYQQCGVSAGDTPVMHATVDEQRIRPYFNAGLLAVRPTEGLLRAWSSQFLDSYADPAFQPFYDQHAQYRIFLHQAILAGVILARLHPAQWCELPWHVNYPLHMHGDYPAARRARRLNDLVSCRYDTLTPARSWSADIAIDDPLRSWLVTQRSQLYPDAVTGPPGENEEDR